MRATPLKTLSGSALRSVINIRPPRISIAPCKLVGELEARDLEPGNPVATEGDDVVISSLPPISGAAAFNEPKLALGGGGVVGVSAMIPLGSETMFIGSEAASNFAALSLLFTL